MAKLNSKSAINAILQGDVETADLYVITGTDGFIDNQLLKLITEHYLAPQDEEFNLDIIDCRGDTPAKDIVSAVSEVPVMCDKRLLILRNAHELKSDTVKKASAAFQANLSYHANAVALTTKSMTKGTLADAASKSRDYMTLTYDCKLDDLTRERWTAYLLQQNGLQFRSDIACEIANRTGNDSQFLVTRIEKLRQYMGTRTEVTKADINAIITKSLEVKTWELTSAIGAKKYAQAWRLAEVMLNEDNPDLILAAKSSAQQSGQKTVPASVKAIGLLSYINTYLRSMAQLRSLAAQYGTSPATLASHLPGKKEYQIRKSLAEMQTWSESNLKDAFSRLCLTDQSIKLGRSPLLAIQLMIASLCFRR